MGTKANDCPSVLAGTVAVGDGRGERRTIARDRLTALFCRHLTTSTGAAAALPNKEH